MRLICSGYVPGSTSTLNAARTASIIRHAQSCGLEVELCVGMYQGLREISASITGFTSEEELLMYARVFRNLGSQEAVYVESMAAERAWLCTAHRQLQLLGKPRWSSASTHIHFGNHTAFLDGRVLYTESIHDI